jgi:hypothetical protein
LPIPNLSWYVNGIVKALMIGNGLLINAGGGVENIISKARKREE